MRICFVGKEAFPPANVTPHVITNTKKYLQPDWLRIVQY